MKKIGIDTYLVGLTISQQECLKRLNRRSRR